MAAVSAQTTLGAALKQPLQNRVRVAGFGFGVAAATTGVTASIAGVDVPVIAFVAAAAFTLLGLGVGRIASMRVHSLDVVALGYVSIRFVSEGASASALAHSANFPGLSSNLIFLAAYFCARIAVRDLGDFRSFIGGLAVPSIIVSTLAIAQIAFAGIVGSWILEITNSAGAQSRLADGRLTRATSLIGHWSGLGGYLFCAIAICGIAIAIDRQAGRVSRSMQIGLVAALVASAATFTFAVIIVSFAVFVTVMSALGYRVRGLVAIGAVVTAAWLLFGDSLIYRLDQQTTTTGYLPAEYSWLPATISVRIHYWLTQGLPAFAEQPVWGWGHSVYSLGSTWPIQPSTISWPYPESEYVKALVTGGVIEFATLVALILVVIRYARRSELTLGAGPRKILVALVLGIVVGSLINPYLTNPGLPGLLWPLLGAIGWTSASSGSVSSPRRVSGDIR